MKLGGEMEIFSNEEESLVPRPPKNPLKMMKIAKMSGSGTGKSSILENISFSRTSLIISLSKMDSFVF